MNQLNRANWSDSDKEWYDLYIADSPETELFHDHVDEDGVTFSLCVPRRYAWPDAPVIVRDYAEKVDFPKDRDIIIYCFFFVTRGIMVDQFFILEENEEADIESIIIDFDDFPEIDFTPLYEFVAQDAKAFLSKEGYDVTSFYYVPFISVKKEN